MKIARTLLIAALPIALVAGCETATEEKPMVSDKTSADVMQAESAARRAADDAARAAAAAERSAADAKAAAEAAKAAGDRVDRAFRQAMRK